MLHVIESEVVAQIGVVCTNMQNSKRWFAIVSRRLADAATHNTVRSSFAYRFVRRVSAVDITRERPPNQLGRPALYACIARITAR
eukprot:2219586-Prymnesium_polylepis.1